MFIHCMHVQSVSPSYIDHMLTACCTHAFSAHADLLLLLNQPCSFSKMVDSGQVWDINFKQNIFKIPEKEGLKVCQLHTRLREFDRQVFVVSIQT